MSSVASLAAYRIVQEGLTNAAKHGDGAVDLATVWCDDGLTVTKTFTFHRGRYDIGRGFYLRLDREGKAGDYRGTTHIGKVGIDDPAALLTVEPT